MRNAGNDAFNKFPVHSEKIALKTLKPSEQKNAAADALLCGKLRSWDQFNLQPYNEKEKVARVVIKIVKVVQGN